MAREYISQEEKDTADKIYMIQSPPNSCTFIAYADSFIPPVPYVKVYEHPDLCIWEETDNRGKVSWRYRVMAKSRLDALHQVIAFPIQPCTIKKIKNYRGQKYNVITFPCDDDFPLTREEISRRTGFDWFGQIHSMEHFDRVFQYDIMLERMIQDFPLGQGTWNFASTEEKNRIRPINFAKRITFQRFSYAKLLEMKAVVLENGWHITFEPPKTKKKAAPAAKQFVLLTHKCPQCNAELKIEGTLASCAYCNSKFTVAERSILGH